MTEANDERIFLDGFIDVPADRLEAVSAALPTHIRLTLAEPGCLAFWVVPSAEVEGRFIVSEIFEDRSAFDAHQERTRNSAWAQVTEGIPRQYTVRGGEIR